MKDSLKPQFFLRVVIALLVTALAGVWQPGAGILAQGVGNDVLYTTDADFDLGTLVSVNHDSPNNNQIQLDSQVKPFPFINVAASGRGTVVRTNTETGEIVGEYRTAPEGRGLNPSRTTVDLFGNVWTANRGESGEIDGVPHGSAVKIGLIAGGTRVNENGEPNPNGGFLAPPFGYNTCADRNGDGLIRTSRGLLDILEWPDVTDGLGGVNGLVEDAEDECILIYQRLPDAEQARHVSVDADNNVWVGGYPFAYRRFYKLDSTTGAILDSFDARNFGCGGYGGLIDGNGILWSVGGPLLRYDPVTRTGKCIQQYGYGLGIDTNGYIWMALWDGGIVKVTPDGTVVPGFPKHTYPDSMITSSLPGPEETGLLAALSEIESGAPEPAPAEDTSAKPLAPNGPAPEVKAGLSAPTGELAVAAFTQLELREENEPLTDPTTVTFRAAPFDEWVQSSSPWTPGATITLTIEDGGAVVYSNSQTANGDGNFHFNLWNEFDLQPGHVVTVADGVTTKTHTILPLYVDGVNTAADTVHGRAQPGTDVDIWVHGGAAMTVTPDGSGSWTADYTSLTDLTAFSDGGTQQFDADGDSTGVWWTAPRVQVSPNDDWVQSYGVWKQNATVSLTIEDGGSVVYSDSQLTDSNGRFNFNLWDILDLQRGMVVTITDGTITKIHTVMPLFVDVVNVAASSVSGRGVTGVNVDVWVHGLGGMPVMPDGDGNWTADFTGLGGLTFYNDGGAQQSDEDGDLTGVWWAAPRFRVSPEDDWVQSWNRWQPGQTINLTIEDGGVVVYSNSKVTDNAGNFFFNLRDAGFDLQRGQVVTVSDGTNTKTHTVMPLYVDGIDVAADTLFGRGEAGVNVDIWVHGDGGMTVLTDASGNWTADLSGQTDLTYASDGGTQQTDADGDSTGVWWAAPRIQVAPDDDWVQSWSRWTPGTIVTLTIEDGGAVVYSDSQTTDQGGSFHFSLGGIFDLQRGQVVTVSDGTNTKTHTVMPLYVDGVDVATDTISGRGVPDKTVEVWVHGDGNLYPTVDGSGNWTADFSGQADLTFFSDGGSQQIDDDGDSTGVWWASPRIQVAPENEWVQSRSRWTPGKTVTLTIEDSGVVVYSDSQTVDPHGNFHFGLWDVFDLQRGQVVTVSDGTNTKTHTVMPLYIDEIAPASDTISGRGAPGLNIDIWVHGDGSLSVMPDSSGRWTADFSGQADLTYFTTGGSQQTDEDADSTAVWWYTPALQASPVNNWVQSWGAWTPNATIHLTVEEGGEVVFTDSQTADSHGNFNFNVWGVDLEVGHQVTVSDGVTTKTHTITGLQVTGLDAASDRIFGTGTPGAILWIKAYLFDQGAERVAYAGNEGIWTADFSVEADGQPVYDVTGVTFVNANEFDEDGDSTYRRGGPPVLQNRGVAVTPADNHVWVANSGVGTVTRLDNDGNVLKVIETGQEPTGVAVDAAGKVWATNMGSQTAVRIDPNAGEDGLGAVDLTVDLGQDAWPYNYSDMTGAVVVGSTSPQGFWTVIQDSQIPGFEWGRVTWNTEPQGSQPPGTAIVVEARAADNEASLGGQVFQPLVNGELFSMFGRYIEVRVTLKAGPDGTSPVLSDLRIQPHVIPVEIDIKPGSYPNSINCKNNKETITVALLTTETFNALSVDHTTVTFEGSREMHLDKRTGLPVLHVEDIGLDGDLDLVFHFRLIDTALTCSSTAGTLKGQTFDGIPVEGTDSVRMVKR